MERATSDPAVCWRAPMHVAALRVVTKAERADVVCGAACEALPRIKQVALIAPRGIVALLKPAGSDASCRDAAATAVVSAVTFAATAALADSATAPVAKPLEWDIAVVS